VSTPLTFLNIDRQENIELILDYLEDHNNDFGNIDHNNYWSGRTIYLDQIDSKEVFCILMSSLEKTISKIESITNKKVFCETFNIARWPAGYELRPHADGVDNDYPWRHFGAVTFLNNDFDGGVLYYPYHNIEIQPTVGYTAIHSGGNQDMHGVTEITRGCRYTTAAFFTFDKKYEHKIRLDT
jgi:hypothetical protein